MTSHHHHGAHFEPNLYMPTYLTIFTPTKTDIPAQASRGRMTFFLRLLFALAGLVAVARAGTVAAPVVSPATGTYSSPQTMTLSTVTSGISIAYTTDGSIPTESGGTITHGSLYTIPVTISATTTVNAISFKKGLTDSPVLNATYTVNPSLSATTPALSPSGMSANAQLVPMISSRPTISLMTKPAGTSRILPFAYLKAKPVQANRQLHPSAISSAHIAPFADGKTQP